MKRRENPFTIQGFIALLGRNVLPSLMTITIGILLSLLFYSRTEKTYVAKTTFLIPSSYFDLLQQHKGKQRIAPEELDAYRLALVRKALSDEFLDLLGEKYGIFERALDDPKHSIERQVLRGRFEVVTDLRSTIKVAVLTPSALEAVMFLNDFLEHVTLQLSSELSDEQGGKRLEKEDVITIVEAPVQPTAPLHPHRGDFVAIGAVLGTLIALAQLIFHEYQRTQFLYPDEVAEALQVPFLGDLPSISRIEWLYLLDNAKTAQQKLLS